MAARINPPSQFDQSMIRPGIQDFGRIFWHPQVIRKQIDVVFSREYEEPIIDNLQQLGEHLESLCSAADLDTRTAIRKEVLRVVEETEHLNRSFRAWRDAWKLTEEEDIIVANLVNVAPRMDGRETEQYVKNVADSLRWARYHAANLKNALRGLFIIIEYLRLQDEGV